MNILSRLNEAACACTAWLKRAILKPVSACPAAWCFAAIWAIAATYLVVIGRGDIVLSCVCLLTIIMFFCVVTVGITRREDKPRVTLSRTRGSLLLLQLAVIAFFICITFYTSLMFHGVVERRPIPLWSDLIDVFSRLGEGVFSNNVVVNPALAMANPAQYFLLPLPLLLLLGARPTELGFSRGHRTLSVIGLWCLVPVGVLIYLIAFGRLSCSVLLRRLLSHLLINGFGEEFLVRGALQTRLRAVLNPSWAIVIQAPTFAIWHLGANFGSLGITGGTELVAFCLVKSAPFGLAHGIVFQRTRKLVACSAIHVVINSLAG